MDSLNLNAYINKTVAFININHMDSALISAEKALKIDSTSQLAQNNLNYIRNRKAPIRK